MSAARRAPAKKAKKADPGTVCRELVAAAEAGKLPRTVLLLGPARGEEEPWFAEQILAAARRWARQHEEFDLLEVDGGSPDFEMGVVDSFLSAPGLFGGERVLLFARAGKAMNAARKICPTGMMKPANTPSATPRGTLRRVKRQSSGVRNRWAIGRKYLFCAICSRVGMRKRIQSASAVFDLRSLIATTSPCAASLASASGGR